MMGQSERLHTSNSKLCVLLIAVCVGLITLSAATPLAHPKPNHDAKTGTADQSFQSPTPVESINNTSDFPPGTAKTGIENVTRLIEAHQSVLNNSTYTAQVEWDQISGVSDQRVTDFQAVPITVKSTSGPSSSLVKVVSEDVVNEYWITEHATAHRLRFGSPSQSSLYTYGDQATDRGFQESISTVLHEWLNSSTYDYTGTITRDNQTLYEFWATGLRGNTAPIANTHARVLVDQAGGIHEATFVRIYSPENDSRTARLNYSLQTDVVPPTQPDWVTTKLPHLNSSIVGNGAVIALEHTGGRPISNATIRTFFPDGRDIDVEIDGFEPGETLYLYRLRGSPDRVRLSFNEAPEVNDSFVPVGEDSVFVSVFNRPASFFGANESLLIEVEPGN